MGENFSRLSTGGCSLGLEKNSWDCFEKEFNPSYWRGRMLVDDTQELLKQNSSV